MAKGKTLYLLALAAGGGGMLTFGWDAGVLGGFILTEEFQTAMGVSEASAASTEIMTDYCNTDARYRNILNDHLRLPPCLMARVHDHGIVRNETWPSPEYSHWQLDLSYWNDHLSFQFQLRPNDCLSCRYCMTTQRTRSEDA